MRNERGREKPCQLIPGLSLSLSSPYIPGPGSLSLSSPSIALGLSPSIAVSPGHSPPLPVYGGQEWELHGIYGACVWVCIVPVLLGIPLLYLYMRYMPAAVPAFFWWGLRVYIFRTIIRCMYKVIYSYCLKFTYKFTYTSILYIVHIQSVCYIRRKCILTDIWLTKHCNIEI